MTRQDLVDLSGHAIGQDIPMVGRLHLLLFGGGIGDRLRDTNAAMEQRIKKQMQRVKMIGRMADSPIKGFFSDTTISDKIQKSKGKRGMHSCLDGIFLACSPVKAYSINYSDDDLYLIGTQQLFFFLLAPAF